MVFDFLGDALSDVGDFIFGEELIGPLPQGTAEAARPNVGGLFGDVKLSDVGDLLGSAGGITRAFADPMQQQRTANVLPYVSDFYENTYFPALEDFAQSDYVGRPTRRALIAGQDEAFDPIFGSYGLSDLQSYMDEIVASTPSQGTTPPIMPEASPQGPIVDDFGSIGGAMASAGGIGGGSLSQLAYLDNKDNSFLAHEDKDLAYIRALTGNPNATSLPGWDPVTETYLPRSHAGRGAEDAGNDMSQLRQGLIGGKLHGQTGYRMAEDAAVREAYERMYKGTPDEQNSRYNIIGQDAVYTNPYGAGEYNRRNAINAMLKGDFPEMRRQSHAAHYDPTSDFVDIAGGLLAGALASPIAGGVSAALGGGTLGSLGKFGTNQLLGRARA